jgi:hypothetical protein
MQKDRDQGNAEYIPASEDSLNDDTNKWRLFTSKQLEQKALHIQGDFLLDEPLLSTAR